MSDETSPETLPVDRDDFYRWAGFSEVERLELANSLTSATRVAAKHGKEVRQLIAEYKAWRASQAPDSFPTQSTKGAKVERFKVAHFQEQGQQVVVIFVSDQFELKGETQKQAIYETLASAAAQHLAGAVTLVWQPRSGGPMKFFGPAAHNAFFRSMDYQTLAANINKELTI